MNSWSQGGSGGGYTVRAGDTLAALALSFWGDASLWYKLAEANGLSGASSLYEGQRLAIPAGVMRNTHNASTLRPYDPASAVGDTSPTSPKPQKKNKCGMFGQILLVAIAVAVSVVSYGALTTAATGMLGAIGAGALSGAAGSIVSQGFGVATGIQQGFSWKGVAMAAIGGAVGGGLGKFAQLAGEAGKLTGALKDAASFLGKGNFGSGLVNGAVGNALTQGIGAATGLQKKFDFAGVAAAALGGGVGNMAGGWLKAGSLQANRSVGNHFANAGASAASAIANAATRTVLSGTSFGDNLIAALPDVIGSTIGNMLAHGVSGSTPTVVAEMRSETGAPSGTGTMASPGSTADVLIDPRTRGSVTAEEAAAASAGILSVLPAASGSGGVAFGEDGRYQTGTDPLTRWLASEGMKAGRASDFDDYAGTVWGGNVDGLVDLLHGEFGGVAAGQLANTLTMLGYLAGNGSTYAGPVASGVYDRTSVPAAAAILGSNTNTLTGAFDTGVMLAAMHSAQPGAVKGFTSAGYVMSNPNTGPTLRQRAANIGNAMYHLTLGPGSAYDRIIVRPFYGIASAISASPLGDPGVWMALEQAGAGAHPVGALPGAVGYTAARALQRFHQLRMGPAGPSGLGDLTIGEVAAIQGVVNTATRPLEVVGSAARGTRHPASDIDYIVPPSSFKYYEGLESLLPKLDPRHGILRGYGNPAIGPVIRFEPKV